MTVMSFRTLLLGGVLVVAGVLARPVLAQQAPTGDHIADETAEPSTARSAIAHVFSTYESRRAAADPTPFQRGINGIQLLFDGHR